MPDPDHHHDYFALTPKEIDYLLEPIRDHSHCWGFISQAMIQVEKSRRARVRESRRLGPYNDWPGDAG